MLVVCVGLFLGAELAAWRADRRRNPERSAIRGQAITFRLDRVPVHHARIEGRDKVKGFKGLALVVREHGVELSHFVPGYLMLFPDWYRNVDDVVMDIVGREGLDSLRLTLRSGDRYDEVWLTPTPVERASAWEAMAAVGVSGGSKTSNPA